MPERCHIRRFVTKLKRLSARTLATFLILAGLTGGAYTEPVDANSAASPLPAASIEASRLGAVSSSADRALSMFRESIAAAANSANSLADGAAAVVIMAGRTLSETVVQPIARVIDDITDWPSDTLHGFVDDMNSDDFAQFARLVNHSGFAIESVDFRLGIFPGAGITFAHERNLTEAELSSLRHEVERYHSDLGFVSSYIETTVLRGLVVAGEHSQRTRLKQVQITLFPLPSLEFAFDPFEFGKHRETHFARPEQVTREAVGLVKLQQQLRIVEDRLSDLENNPDSGGQ